MFAASDDSRDAAIGMLHEGAPVQTHSHAMHTMKRNHAVDVKSA